MSGGDSSLTGEASPPAPRRASGWALASVLCSVAVCPLLTLLGPLLGIKALLDIRSTGRAGRGLALAGIVIGTVVTAGWLVAGSWWHRHARVPLMNGPVVELRAGLAGDIAAFRSGFVGDGSSGSDAEVRRFLAELSARYGTLDAIRQRSDPDAEATWTAGQVRIPYLMEFVGGTIDMEASFVIQREGTPGFVLRWAWIAVLDPEQGDLVYPESARAEVERVES